MSCPQPTPQYGQIERATCASSIRACIARVVSDVGEIGPATTAIALDEMTTETGFVVKKLPAFKDWSARRAYNFFGERQRLKIWRPGRLLSRNPKRADHDHRQ